MSKWYPTTIKNLVSLQRGYDLTAKERTKGNIPVMGAAGKNGCHGESKALGPGIVIGRSGGSFGQVHFVSSDYWPHNTSMFITDFKGNDVKFIYYLLKNLNFNRLNSGSAQPSLNRNYVYPIKVIVPEIKYQKKIASILSALDQKIELNNRINAQLEAMAKMLYDYWFVQFDFPDKNGKPYKTTGGKMTYNPTLKREVPDGWEVGKLADIANITMGQSPEGSSYNADGKGTIFYQGSTDFGWLFPTTRQYTTEPSRLVKQGDILLSVRAPVGDMNIANTDCCIGRGLAALNSKTNSDSFLFYTMKYFKQIFDRHNYGGTTFGSITKNDLHSLGLSCPPANILEKFDKTTSKYNELIYCRAMESRHLAQLRDWLLPMLMNGQVTVT